MLIDDSGRKVAVSSKLVNEAGVTMQQVADSAQRVTGIMAEITVATEEQSQGIAQVNEAIGALSRRLTHAMTVIKIHLDYCFKRVTALDSFQVRRMPDRYASKDAAKRAI